MTEKDDILEEVEREGIKFIEMQFMDILGRVKSVSIPAKQLEKAIDDGVLFDGSSIAGYATIDESDMRAYPDLNAFHIFPWSGERTKTAGLICNIHDSTGNRFDGDPRYVLERAMKDAEKMGFRFNTGPEFEFFLFRLNEKGEITARPDDYGGYFDLTAEDRAEQVRKESALILDGMGFNVETTHHEVAPGQHEIDLRYADAMTSADRVMILEFAIKTVAMKHRLFASFMPKPIYGVNGNGMHVHQSLEDFNGRNAFYDENALGGLSQTARYYIGGLLEHAQENCAILASWVNSYKRLIPGYEAPVYISWAHLNRSALIRVPAGRGQSTRLEVRNPDPAGNPYLQFAVLLASGLDGIKREIEPPASVEGNIFKRKDNGIETLPGNLGHALSYLEKSEFMRNVLGDHITDHFLHVKHKEWNEYRAQVTDWEVKTFLSIL